MQVGRLICGEYFHVTMQDLHAVQSDNFNIHKYICVNIVEIRIYALCMLFLVTPRVEHILSFFRNQRHSKQDD